VPKAENASPNPAQTRILFSRKKQPEKKTSLTLKGRGNPVKYLAQGHNKRTCRPIFTLSLFNAERQAGKQ